MTCRPHFEVVLVLETVLEPGCVSGGGMGGVAGHKGVSVHS